MGVLAIQMLGRFCLRYNSIELTSLETRKAQELLCYLLLHRQRPHPREVLATVFWSNTATAQSRANLRKTLWQLQSTLHGQIDCDLVLTDAEWVGINPNVALSFDVAVLENSVAQVSGQRGEEMSATSAATVSSAVELYHGDLLDGWYQDWCLFERERIQNLYLSLIEKLMGYYEHNHEYERGVQCGAELLHFDRTREDTYRRLMRMHFQAGDRATALRQYERCVIALREELNVGPSVPTVDLYERIRSNHALDAAGSSTQDAARGEGQLLHEVLARLRQMRSAIASLRREVDDDIWLIEGMVYKQD